MSEFSEEGSRTSVMVWSVDVGPLVRAGRCVGNGDLRGVERAVSWDVDRVRLEMGTLVGLDVRSSVRSAFGWKWGLSWVSTCGLRREPRASGRKSKTSRGRQSADGVRLEK